MVTNGLDVSLHTLTQRLTDRHTERNSFNAVKPVYYRQVGTSHKCPDYQGVLIFQVSLHDNVSFGTTAKCVDYAGVHIFKCPD